MIGSEFILRIIIRNFKILKFDNSNKISPMSHIFWNIKFTNSAI